MEYVEKFLLANGFKLKSDIKNHEYENDKCTLVIHSDCYAIYIKAEKGFMFSKDLTIYWLIGVLTWMNIIPKDYIKP